MKTVVLAGAVALSFGAAGAAFAADIPAPAAPVVVAPAVTPAPAASAPYDWSGAFVGVFGGVAAADFDYAAFDGAGTEMLDIGVTGRGLLGGVRAGYDFQFGSIVAGLSADIALTNIAAQLDGTIPGLGTAAISSELRYLGTVQARLGYAWDRLLVYAHGGLAYGETDQRLAVTPAGGAVLAVELDDSRVKLGWTAGAGAEYAITDRLSIATEYAFTDLGEDTLYADPALSVSEDLQFHTLTVGVNFRF